MGDDQKGPPLIKICHTYPRMIKIGAVILYLKKIQKKKIHVTHPLSSADTSIFYWKSAHFAISRNTDLDCILMHYFKFFYLFLNL